MKKWGGKKRVEKRIERISLASFILSTTALILINGIKLTGFALAMREDPNPIYGVLLLIITLLSASVYFWIQMSHKKKS